MTEVVHHAIDQIALSESEKRIRELETELKRTKDELAKAKRPKPGGKK